MTTQARLQLLAARGREASAAKAVDNRPFVPPRKVVGEPCPGCGGGCHTDGKVLTCPDCGEFDRNGRGGWSRRGHSGGIACLEVLGFPAPLLPDLPGRTVLRVQRNGETVDVDAHDDFTAAELRTYVGTVAQWLESRGEWLREALVLE